MYRIDLHEQKKKRAVPQGRTKSHALFLSMWVLIKSFLWCQARDSPHSQFQDTMMLTCPLDAWHLTLLLPFHVYGWDVQEDKETQTQSFFFLLSQISVYFSLATHPANKKKTGFWQVAKKIISVETQADCQNTVMPDYYASTSVYQYLKSHPLSFIHQFY